MTAPVSAPADAVPDLRELPTAQDLVLAARPLRPGVVLADTSRFGDDVWRLEPAILQRHVASVTLRFTTIPPRYRLHAKQLCYAMLSGPLPAGEKRHSPVGIHGALAALRRFLRWLDTRPTAPERPQQPALAELTARDLDDYNRHLLTIRHVGTRQHAQRAVRLLWRYRRGLTDPLPMDPHHVHEWVGAHRPRENTTDRIPEPVLSALISWAMRFVDQFASDILAADAWSKSYRSRLTNGQRGRTTGARDDLQSYLDSHVQAGRPLPGLRGKPNTRFISVQAGLNATSLNTRRDMRALIHAAATQVGATDHTWLPIPISGVLDGQPWITGIAQQHPTQSLNILRRMLHIACYTVIAFLSGMRDAEVKHLHRGCVTTLRDPDGRPYRWKLASRAFKGENDPAGTPASWIVGHPAARAVEVLEQLQPTDQPLLFAHLRFAAGISTRTNEVQTTKCTNKQLLDFVAWINAYCAEHHRTDGIPAVNDRSWPLSSRQFRRTLAWFIARRPGGSIAGAIQYRHLSVQMFEGYAGTSDSGFRAEVEAEQALARGEHLLAMIDAHEHTQLGGPAADEAARRLDQFGEHARFAGTLLVDDRRLVRLMRRQDPAIYPGTFATCVFQPDKALCQQHRDGRGTPRPGLGDCRPLECGNVALTTDNSTALRAELDHITDQLALRPSLPPLLHHRLRSRHDQITHFLDRHTPATNPETT